MRFRLLLIVLFMFLLASFISSSIYALMPVQQDEKEIEAKKAPTGEILKGGMEDIRKEKEKILEAEKKKPRIEEDEFILEKKKPFLSALPDEEIQHALRAGKERVEPTESYNLILTSKPVEVSVILLFLAFIAFQFYKILLSQMTKK